MTYLKIALGVLTLSLLAAISSCNKEEPTAEELFLGRIGQTWTVTSVDVDGVVASGAFAGFQLSITKNRTYTTVNGNAPIWPASGTFTLEETSATPGFNLLRDDGVQIAVEELTETRLLLKFHYESPGGRSASVTGNYTFDLSK